MKTKNLIIYILICLIVIAGIAVWNAKGFNTELQFSSRKQIVLSNYTGIEISDIKSIVSEILGNTEYIIQPVETFGNSVSIVARDITEEQKTKIIEKFNEKYKTELKSDNIKVLIVAHPYNLYDEYIGKPIIKLLENENVSIIYSNLFNSEKTRKLSKKLSKNLYFKYNKENIGAIEVCKDKIDGIIFLTTFPCGPDSIANELVIRKIKLPYLNLIIDDMDGLTGFETRIESFIDIIKERSNYAKNSLSNNG